MSAVKKGYLMNQQQKMKLWGKTSGGNSEARRWRYRHQPVDMYLHLGLCSAKIGKKKAKRLRRESIGQGLSLLKKADAQTQHSQNLALTAKKPSLIARLVDWACSFRRGGENYAGC